MDSVVSVAIGWFIGVGRGVVLEREEGEAIGVFVIPATRAPREEDHGTGGEEEAAENEDGYDAHVGSEGRVRSRVAVCQTRTSELTGIRTAQSTGVIRPAKQRARAIAL